MTFQTNIYLFSIITQVIIEIPNQRNVKFYHNLHSYHAALKLN